MMWALLESRKALPECRPNPPVGCVIVLEDEVVSRGFTGPPGTAHAEASAISALPPAESGVALSAFVTLEPCSFHGRTPSCAVALINRGIRSVFVGIVDPDPRNNGKGLQLLRVARYRVSEKGSQRPRWLRNTLTAKTTTKRAITSRMSRVIVIEFQLSPRRNAPPSRGRLWR